MARTPGTDAIYEVADLYRQRCLVENKSLLWPDDAIWTVDNINEIESSAFDSNSKFRNEELKYWDDISRTLNLPLRKLGADIALMYQLFPNKSADSKAGDVRWMFEGEPELVPEERTWALVQQAFSHGLGNAGRWYSSGGQESSSWFYAAFARQAEISAIDVYDRPAVQQLADQVEQQIQYNTMSARHMLLHLLFPDHYESIASSDHKQKVRAALGTQLNLSPTDDIDFDIMAIRSRLVEQGRPEPFGFYDADLRDIWDKKTPRTPRISESTEPVNQEDEVAGGNEPDYSNLLTATYLSASFFDDVSDLLLDKRQLIFEGPPGSGKTYVAEKFARWFTGQSLDDDTPLNEQVEIVQFHQSYGYEDFVQGIRPETNDDGQLVYKVREGIFLKLCELAASNTDKRFVLIIDEINRGNLSRIFGELLLLLEYRGMSVQLPYGSGDQATLTIPKNLYIIGTMNTADRSLSQIDYALRRRFYFVRFMPVENGRAEVFETWLESKNFDTTVQHRLLDLFVSLNRGIREHLNTDDLQVGHSYFMQDDIDTEAGLNRVWTRAVRPLLEEYLHHHRNREEILEVLTPASLRRDIAEPVPVDEAGPGDVAASIDPDQV